MLFRSYPVALSTAAWMPAARSVADATCTSIGRSRVAQRQGVLEMRELRPQTTQQPRQRPRHPPLLRTRGQRHRFDSLRDELRVSGKNRDELQSAIAFLRKGEYGLDLQFVNFRD